MTIRCKIFGSLTNAKVIFQIIKCCKATNAVYGNILLKQTFHFHIVDK